jgi:hypothetical protein
MPGLLSRALDNGTFLSLRPRHVVLIPPRLSDRSAQETIVTDRDAFAERGRSLEAECSPQGARSSRRAGPGRELEVARPGQETGVGDDDVLRDLQDLKYRKR